MTEPTSPAEPPETSTAVSPIEPSGRTLEPVGTTAVAMSVLAPPAVVLDVHGAQHAFRRTVALRGVDLQVHAGEVVAITGLSGGGKSTLLHIAAGLLTPQAGSVSLLGHDLSRLTEDQRARLRRREVGIVLQFGQLVPELSAIDNVALPLLLDGRPADGARRLAADWLERCGAAGLAATLPPDLSGGEAQRVAIARALITGPSIIFADEPTGSLDTIAGREVLALLLSAVRERGASLVIVTHDNTVAAKADREVRLVDGVLTSQTVLR